MLNLNTVLITFIVVLGVGVAGMLIRKKYDIRVVLFGTGIFFMLGAAALGLSILPEESSSGILFFDVFRQIGNTFVGQLSGAGLIIMMLFGFSAYMSEIGANGMTVKVLSAPLLKIKNKRMIVPVFFLIASSLCMIIPSASNLGALLMATAFPALVKAGVSPLTSAAMIAMAAGVAPTPLGSDNVVIHGYLDMSLNEFVFGHHALVSIPVILVLCVVQYFWQGYCDARLTKTKVESRWSNPTVTSTSSVSLISAHDRKDGEQTFSRNAVTLEGNEKKVPLFYAVLPMLPLIFMIVFTILEALGYTTASLQLVELTFVALLIAVVVDGLTRKKAEASIGAVKSFFTGMSTGFVTVVVQVVAAMTFISGLRVLGVIDGLSAFTSDVVGGGWMAIIVFCLLIVAVGLISGTGLSLFMGLIPVIPLFAYDAEVSAVTMMISMQFTAHFVKTISPLAPVMIITSGMMNVSPIELAKRTVVPSVIGATLSILLAYVLF